MASFLNGITGALGITGSRDNDQGNWNVQQYGDTLKQGQDRYGAELDAGNRANNQLAGNNYLQGADNNFLQQQQNFGQQQQAYNNQQQASRMLYNQATGATPSVADMTMQQGLGNANNQVQSAMLSQQGGMSPGLSQRNMLDAQAIQNASIVGQGQINRAGEIAQAQQAYNSTLGNISGQANAMGSTLSGMTNQQMGMGQSRYNQGRDALSYYTGNANNRQSTNATNAQNLLAGQQGNLAAAAQSNQAQAKAMGQTLSSAATMGL